MAEPRGFVVVGDTDCWDVGNRGPDILLDSRLRRTVGVSGIGNFDSIFNSRAIVPTATPLYAELVNESGSSAIIFGVCGVSQAASVRTSFPGASSNSWGMRLLNTGNIYNNGSAVTTGLGGGAAGDRMALAIRDDAGTVKVQFYKVTAAGVRTTFGSEVSFSADAAGFYLCVGHNTSTNFATLMVDGPDLLAIPAGAQPWGAAARVADRGGYSPGATVWNATSGTISSDAFRKTATYTGLDASSGSHRADNSPDHSRSSRLLYVEFVTEVILSANLYIGLHPFNTAIPYMGNAADSYGVSTGGTKRNNGTNTVIAAWARADGNRYGVFWNPSSGGVWFALNGVVAEGDPEAGTGASFTTAAGLHLVPAGTWETNGQRVRLCTHAREQRFRPAYAEAWDGSDLLPEQYFGVKNQAGGGVKSFPEVDRSVGFHPWGTNSKSSVLGALDLHNSGGEYDVLTQWDLRNQPVIAYRVDSNGELVREWTGVVDGVSHPDSKTCRIAVAETTVNLDVHVEPSPLVIGSPYLVPVQAVPDTVGDPVFEVCQAPAALQILDRAAYVYTWDYDELGGMQTFTRSVNIAGKQSCVSPLALRKKADVTVLNSKFENWSGAPEEPDDWGTFVSGFPETIVSRNGDAVVLTAPLGTPGIALIFQDLTPSQIVVGKTYAIVVKINGGSYGTGFSMSVGLGGFTKNIANDIDSYGNQLIKGEVVAFITPTSAATNVNIGVSAPIGADAVVEVGAVRIYEAYDTRDLPTALATLIEDYAGMPVDSWEYTAPFGAYYPSRVGFWTNDRPTVRSIVDQIAESHLFDYYTDENGVIKLAWLYPPDEADSSDPEWIGEIKEGDLFGPITYEDDYAPRLSTLTGYRKNYDKHSDGDVVDAARIEPYLSQYVTRDLLERELDVSSPSPGEALPFHPFYNFASSAKAWVRLTGDVLFDSPDTSSPTDYNTNGSAIAVHRSYSEKNKFVKKVTISMELYDRIRPHPGGTVEFTHRRYGMQDGQKLYVKSVKTKLGRPTAILELWGKV